MMSTFLSHHFDISDQISRFYYIKQYVYEKSEQYVRVALVIYHLKNKYIQIRFDFVSQGCNSIETRVDINMFFLKLKYIFFLQEFAQRKLYDI